MEKIITALAFGFGVMVSALILSAIVGLFAAILVLLLWNWLCPDIFGLPEIGYWQAWGLFWLSALLVKGSCVSNSNNG